MKEGGREREERVRGQGEGWDAAGLSDWPTPVSSCSPCTTSSSSELLHASRGQGHRDGGNRGEKERVERLLMETKQHPCIPREGGKERGGEREREGRELFSQRGRV